MSWNPTQPFGDMGELERIDLALPYGIARAHPSLALLCYGARMHWSLALPCGGARRHWSGFTTVQTCF